MSRRSVAVWGLFALLGVALAAGVSLATAEISGQHIGLSSEPITAGKELVPQRQRTATRKRTAHKRSKHAKPRAPVRRQAPRPAAPAYKAPRSAAPKRTSSGKAKEYEYESESGGKHVHVHVHHEDD
jgi:hypothetical protein